MFLKNVTLGVVILFIFGATWYLEVQKIDSRAPTTVGALLTESTLTKQAMPMPTISTSTTLVASTSIPMPTVHTPTHTYINPNITMNQPVANTSEKAVLYKQARDIVPGGGFINAEPFSLKDLVGKKVILVDFWTYSCYNCKNTTPYLKDWYQKYKDQGLEIVGVHTPEFDFEKDLSNVTKAVKDAGIEYPVVQDNKYATWNTYENRYWPHMYLVDIDGYIVYDHIGEGAYTDTEAAIVKALNERTSRLTH